MRKLLCSLILMCVISGLFAQENDKRYIEIVGELNPNKGLGLIDQIQKDDQNTTIFINVNGGKIRVVLKNSTMNESFLSFINTGDRINIKKVDNENKIAIFKIQKDSVKVKIFYAKR